MVLISLLFRVLQLIFHGLLSVVYRGPGESLPPINNLILLDSASALAEKIRSRKLTSVEVVQSFINRIKEINKILNVVVDDRFEAALEDALKADKFIESCGKTKEELAIEYPFLGVPFTVKDCIAVKGLSFTGGLYLRKGAVGEEDADCIASVRRAGAIPLAITNVSELCLWWESYNKIYGRTNNPYNTNHIVGGSSGGEACLQAAGGSPMGIGSDIGGSVRMPAFFNGIFGHKPSPGVGSLKGHYPVPREALQKSFLAAGPMSRFATDLIPLLKVMAPDQAKTLQLDRKVDITKLKYYFMEDDGGGALVSPVDPEIKEAIRKIVAFLKKSHGVTAERVNLPLLKQSMTLWFAKMRAPGDSQLPKELADNKGTVNVFTEILKLPFGLSHHTFPVLSVGVLEQLNHAYGSDHHKKNLRSCDNLKLEFQVCFLECIRIN